jgi:FkbM family methyltransferase
LADEARKPFRGFGLGIMRRLRGTPIDESELVIRECKRLIKGGVFFDVGANIGEVSEALLPLASRVVAIEPDPESYAILTQRLGERAICVPALIGPDGAQRTFLTNTIASKSSTSVAPGEEPPGHDYLKRSTMHSVSLDTIAAKHGMPNLVKIDVEGFEMAVLQSASNILASRPTVVMEFNTLCLSNFGRVNPRAAIDTLMSIFPKIEVITQEGRKLLDDPYVFLSENILQRGALDNLVCSWG